MFSWILSNARFSISKIIDYRIEVEIWDYFGRKYCIFCLILQSGELWMPKSGTKRESGVLVKALGANLPLYTLWSKEKVGILIWKIVPKFCFRSILVSLFERVSHQTRFWVALVVVSGKFMWSKWAILKANRACTDLLRCSYWLLGVQTNARS